MDTHKPIMRWGEDDKRVIRFCEGIGGGAQSQDLDASVFILIRNMGMAAQDAQDFFPDLRLKEKVPELVDLIGDETIQPATADSFYMLMTDDHRE